MTNREGGLSDENRTNQAAPESPETDAGGTGKGTMCNPPGSRLLGNRFPEYASLRREALLSALQFAICPLPGSRSGRSNPGLVLET